MGKTIKIFTLLFLLSGASSQASSLGRLVIRACQRLKNVDMVLSKSEKTKVAVGVSTFGLGLKPLESAYRVRQDNQIKMGLAYMGKKSSSLKK